MLTIFFLTGSSVIVFSSIFGFASILPPSFLVVVLGGTAFGQVVTGILNILTLLIDKDPQNSALYFFSCAAFIVLAAIAVTLMSFRSGPIHFYIKTLSLLLLNLYLTIQNTFVHFPREFSPTGPRTR